MDVSSVVKWICLSTGMRLLIEGDSEVSLADSAVRVGAVSKPTLVGELVRVSSTTIGGNTLYPELEPRILRISDHFTRLFGIGAVVERVLANILDDLLHGEGMQWI